jgi:hypothetical protein
MEVKTREHVPVLVVGAKAAAEATSDAKMASLAMVSVGLFLTLWQVTLSSCEKQNRCNCQRLRFVV